MTSQNERTRIAVVGDIGGHLDELRFELVRLGADPGTGRLPADLVVVQVGDLIHRGPDSVGVLRLVDGYLRDVPAQWVQLVGNHEAQYLRAPAFDWPERLDEPDAAILRRWWRDGQLRAAAAFTTSDGEDFLITHAGLTCGFWREVLGRLTGAARVAAALDSLIGSHEDVLFNAGQMLGGSRPEPLAGPVWASAATELVPSWLEVRMPFSQLHGHSSLIERSGRGAAGRTLRRRTTTEDAARHETTVLDGGRIVGVDPGHGHRPRTPWRSWVATGRPTWPAPVGDEAPSGS